MKHSHIADGNIFNGEQLAIHVRTLNHLLFDPEIPILDLPIKVCNATVQDYSLQHCL